MEKRFYPEFYPNFLKELRALKQLYSYNFIPKLLGYQEKDLSITIQRACGRNLSSILKESHTNQLLIEEIFKTILKICIVLDIEGIYKDEWNRPYKHVFVNQHTQEIKIIDFDRSLFFSNRKNTLQFLSFIFNYYGMHKELFSVMCEISRLLESQIMEYINWDYHNSE
ncbi:MAG: hypothetical protein ABDH21_03005 [bacterium]